MLQNTCDVKRSSMSIDVNERSLSSNVNSYEPSMNIESINASDNVNANFNEDSSEDSIKSHLCDSEKKIFRAPPGVIPYNVKCSNIRRKSDDQRLIFIWPQKNIKHVSCLNSLVPIVRRILVGLVYLGAIHIWPGEFLPTSVPSTAPPPKLPVKCNVIEPLWDEDNGTTIKRSQIFHQ